MNLLAYTGCDLKVVGNHVVQIRPSRTAECDLLDESIRDAVKPSLKNPVREIRTPDSVGVQVTSWVDSLPGARVSSCPLMGLGRQCCVPAQKASYSAAP